MDVIRFVALQQTSELLWRITLLVGSIPFAATGLKGWSWLSILGPVTITYILLYVTGIPPLEQTADKKWGGDPGYLEYKRSTNVLIPWLPRAARR